MSINKSVQHTTAKKLGCPASLKGWGTSYSFHITLCLYLYGIIRLSSNHTFSLQSHFKTVTLSYETLQRKFPLNKHPQHPVFLPFCTNQFLESINHPHTFMTLR